MAASRVRHQISDPSEPIDQAMLHPERAAATAGAGPPPDVD